MATCSHGFEAGSCLICSTLGTAPPARSGTATAIPVGRPEVLAPGRPARRIGVLGVLVAVVAVVLAGWLLLAFLRGILHVFELAVVGVACGYVGYRVGRFTGRRSARR